MEYAARTMIIFNAMIVICKLSNCYFKTFNKMEKGWYNSKIKSWGNKITFLSIDYNMIWIYLIAYGRFFYIVHQNIFISVWIFLFVVTIINVFLWHILCQSCHLRWFICTSKKRVCVVRSIKKIMRNGKNFTVKWESYFINHDVKK